MCQTETDLTARRNYLLNKHEMGTSQVKHLFKAFTRNTGHKNVVTVC